MADPLEPADQSPPMHPDVLGPMEDEFREVPRWPKVVGIIDIVWASLGLGCVGCGIAGIAAQGMFMGTVEQEMGPMPAVMKPTVATFAQMGVGFVSGAFLLITGILCVMRRPVARPLHLVYGIASILITAVGTYLQYSQQVAANEWAAQNPDSKWAQQITQGKPFQLIGLAVGIVLGMAWPVFCLIWFGVVKTRPEQMTGTVDETAA